MHTNTYKIWTTNNSVLDVKARRQNKKERLENESQRKETRSKRQDMP